MSRSAWVGSCLMCYNIVQENLSNTFDFNKRRNCKITRIVSGKPETEDAILDTSLRPKQLTDFIGQTSIKHNLDIAVKAAKGRKEALDHVLLYGPPGLGKTTLAYIIAQEMRANIRVTSGPAIERTGDLAAILTPCCGRNSLSCNGRLCP